MDLIVKGPLSVHYDENCHGQTFLLAADVTRDLVNVLPSFRIVHEEYDKRDEIDNSHTRIVAGAYCIHNIPFEDLEVGDFLDFSVTVDKCNIHGEFYVVARYRVTCSSYRHEKDWKSWSDMSIAAAEIPAWVEEMRDRARVREAQVRVHGRILPEEPCVIVGCVQRP